MAERKNYKPDKSKSTDPKVEDFEHDDCKYLVWFKRKSMKDIIEAAFHWDQTPSEFIAKMLEMALNTFRRREEEK